MRPALNPSEASATARFTETVVLPTPPLPEPTATRCLTPAIGSFGGMGWFAVISTILAICIHRAPAAATNNAHGTGFRALEKPVNRVIETKLSHARNL